VRAGGRKARAGAAAPPRGRPEERGPFPNRPCPCGSKKKYKQCCGAAARAAERRRLARGAGDAAVDPPALAAALEAVQVLHI